MNPKILLKAVSRASGVEVSEVVGPVKRPSYTPARVVFGLLAREAGWPWNRIGLELNREGPSITRLVKGHADEPRVRTLLARTRDALEVGDGFLDELEETGWKLARRWILEHGPNASVTLSLDDRGWLAILSRINEDGDITSMARASDPHPFIALLRAFHKDFLR